MWILIVLFSSYICYKWPSPFPHFLLLQMMVLFLYDESRRLEFVANKKTNHYKNVWLHCTGWDWTVLLNHLSVHLLLNANWFDAGAHWTLLPVSSQKSNSQRHPLSICAGSISVYFGKHNWGIVSFLLNLLTLKMCVAFCVWWHIFSALIQLCISGWKGRL